ncbi:fused signal recognition particle receptor [Xanthomonas translucens]
MSADIAPALPQPPAVPPEMGDAQAAARYAAPLLDAVGQLLAPRDDAADSGAALVHELERIQQALQARDPQRIRRASGVLGRLLGRDLEAQAEAETLSAQLGVVLLRADQHALGVQQRLDGHGALAAAAEAGVAALERWIAAVLAPAGGAPLADAWSWRLQHLQRLAAAWRLEAAQWRLLQQQGNDLLQRYRHIREVLLPAWRQAESAMQAAHGAANTNRAAQAQQRILAEVQAMRARLR